MAQSDINLIILQVENHLDFPNIKINTETSKIRGVMD